MEQGVVGYPRFFLRLAPGRDTKACEAPLLCDPSQPQALFIQQALGAGEGGGARKATSGPLNTHCRANAHSPSSEPSLTLILKGDTLGLHYSLH